MASTLVLGSRVTLQRTALARHTLPRPIPASRTTARAFKTEDVSRSVEESKQQGAKLLESAKLQTEDFAGTFSGKAEEALEAAKSKWEATRDKPTVMAAGAASLLALYILSGVVERIDALPGISTLFQLIGFLTTAWFVARYLGSDEDRSRVHSSVTAFLERLGF
ncbi:TEF13 [Auxenochlorella protothecoides x Auxenochlorella symbiontica]|uniref:Protein CURVATURE THYLAKOID 1A, chloroplastic n=2 Tax=Auxenochlorella protothecoides TaxID=3075 RepID=A0A087SH82_AUXPR|nr:Protein CURVATURE THYLAKOID 1A, chloroplastic [Auxenochlorella protothecoides]KFM25086.1 Protein CURVATURE THYLAKOID 1A, chloroplastic [Auxenochlorella protothecoides]